MQWLMSIDGALSRMGERVLEQALARVAYQDRRHCVREWLGSLEPWDGEERLSRLMPEVFSTADNDYTQRVGQNWLVSLVARVLEPGCKVDTMPVLYGAQGEAKTWALKIIASEQWYDVTQEKTDNKDFLMKLQGKWLIEIGEMHSVATSKVEQGQIKSLLTNDVDRFRPPYTKLMKDFKRQMVFSGTTNHDDWHIDTTGGRRYNPVHCLGAIDLAKLREWRCQLFAEALVKYRHEWKWWLVPVEGHRAALEAQQASGPHDNTIAAWLREYQRGGEMHWDEGPASATLGAEVRARRVEPVGPDVRAETTAERYGNLITTERLVIEGIGAPLGDVVKHQNGISATMMRLGWRKAQRRLGGVRIRYWVCDSPEGYGIAAPAQQELDVEV